MRMQNRLPSYVEVVSPEIIKEIDWEAIPEQAWIPEYNSIYPFHIPEIEFLPDQDLILIDCPSRDMSFMPNGVGYVHNILKKTHITFQTFDLNIVVYHRFHIHRLFDGPEKITTPEGKAFPDDPWLAENEGIWQYPDTIEYFRPELNEIVNALVSGTFEGTGKFTYAIKDGENFFKVLTVEFNTTGYTVYGHRKTKLLREKFRLRNIKGN